jgi:SAM-dependent methyltransferase
VIVPADSGDDAAREPVDDQVAAMRENWRRFARDDPRYYIACQNGGSHEAFIEGEVQLAPETLAWLDPNVGRERFLEIGCGLGRLLRHFAPHFTRVDGIDIAPEMVEGARASGLPENVFVSVGSGGDLSGFADGSIDVVFSSQVLQHIPDAAVVRSYVRETARVLRPNGGAILQFDTRVPSLASRLYFSLPNGLRLRRHRDFIRRYRRDAEWVRRTAAEAGLTVYKEHQPGTDRHWFVMAHTSPA